jgi:hypothetical protein
MRRHKVGPGASARPVSGHDPEEDAAAVMLLYQQVWLIAAVAGSSSSLVCEACRSLK